MYISKNQTDSKEDKFSKFKKDIQSERMFLFKINHLFTDEFEEMIDDILILNESQFLAQLRNRVEGELEETYSDKCFTDRRFKNLLDKGLNTIKSEYKSNYDLISDAYNKYTKNKNARKSDVEFLTKGYRRHCIKEMDNEFATHFCNNRTGKFLLVKKDGKIEFVVCTNCKKVYFSNMISCKCFKCNVEYYTETLGPDEDEYILPATWENYHCKQIANEKIKCIKCHDTFYINLKTGMLVCLNKRCNFTSKPTRILWTCSICHQEFKSGVIPFNPLDLEIIKKIIKQTLFQKQRAHPNRVPCCKVNVFFTEFHHKKKCSGILYSGELNSDMIIVCDKCHAINFYDRFIWTCPKCGNKFRDDKDNSISDDNLSENTVSTDGRKKTDTNNDKDSNIDEEMPLSSNRLGYGGNSKRSNYSHKSGGGGDNHNDKNDNKFTNTKNSKTARYYQKSQDLINENEDNSPKKSFKQYKKMISSRYKKDSQNNYTEQELDKEKEKEKEIEKEKEKDNFKTVERCEKATVEQVVQRRFRRIRFHHNPTEDKDREREEKEERERKEKEEKERKEREEEEKEKEKEKNRRRVSAEDDQKSKMTKATFNVFAKYRQKRKMEDQDRREKEEKEREEREERERKRREEREEKRRREREEREEKERLEKERREKEREEREEKRRREKEEREEKERLEKERREKEREEREREKEQEEKDQEKLSKSSKRLGYYRSFKRNKESAYSSTKQIASSNPLSNTGRKPALVQKENNISEKAEDEPKEKERTKERTKEKPKIEIEEEEEVEEDDSKIKKKRNKVVKIEEPELPKKDDNISFRNRWRFRRPESKKTLGKEIKEETESTTHSNNNNNTDKANNNNTNSNEENTHDNNSHKSNQNNTNSNNNTNKNNNSNSNNNNNNNNNNTNPGIQMKKIPGMSDTLLNHLNKRISNIISKCTIPLMNVEDYILNHKIGEGSYGIIFSVISKKDKKQYALKKIISHKLKQIGEFTKEFELVHSCQHENIMKIYSFCIRILDQTTYALYVLMELSEGDWDKEIKRKLKQRKNYSEKELINILYQLVSALLYIQEKYHISHRDIKPQNVLVFSDGKYKLADFGEAKEAKVSRQINTLRGTELYMSPALYDGLKHERNDVSHNPFKSDVFSLGFCFLYASALNFNLLYEVRDILDSRSINLILHKFLNKFYSEKLIMLLANMLEIDESKRFDFSTIKSYIEENFKDMINDNNINDNE